MLFNRLLTKSVEIPFILPSAITTLRQQAKFFILPFGVFGQKYPNSIADKRLQR